MVIVVLIAIFAPWLAPGDPFTSNMSQALQAPSSHHWFGTDKLGRDVLSRVIYGTQLSLFMGVSIVVIMVSIGTIIGAVAGYFGGKIETILMRLADIMLSFPGIVLAIAIAGILAMHSTCIILDEPTAMLDPTGRAEVMETLLKLHKQGITIVLITHFMEEAIQADRVVVMHDGVIERQGEPHEIFSHVPELLNAGLDVPVAAEIAAGLRKKGMDLPQQIITEKELGDALCL